MTLFLFTYILAAFYLLKKSKYTLLCNDIFWLGIFWVLILGVNLTSGIHYYYSMTFIGAVYLIACISVFFLFRQRGYYKRVKIFAREGKLHSLSFYVVIGLIGVAVFSWDYIRLNGIATTKTAAKSSISIIGSIGYFFVPLLLVLGLYMNAFSLKRAGQYSIKGLILLVAYSLPCILSAGRESVLFVIIGILALFGYTKKIKKHNDKDQIGKKITKRRKIYLIVFSLVIICGLLFLILQISINRFTTNEINMFLSSHDMSSSSMDDAHKWGIFEFLYYNCASYFSHELPFLEFTLREYNGPYMFGMYELNVISRRLPTSLGLDYNMAFAQLDRLFSMHGESFSGGWNTVLGSFIIDFGRIGSLIACGTCGYVLGKFKKKFDRTLDERYAVLIALVCLSAFSTIQLGPFYQIHIYGAYIWWYIIFRRYETDTII